MFLFVAQAAVAAEAVATTATATAANSQLDPRPAYKFVPFAIERDGAWGSEAHQAFGSIVEAAQAGVDAEAFHWSAMNFERHWRQRVTVALGRGQALRRIVGSGTRCSLSLMGILREALV